MESTAVGSYRLKVRLGSHEFEADGPEELVKEQFALFLSAASAIPGVSISQGAGTTQAKDQTDAGGFEGMWGRAYQQEDDRLSLHVLPQTRTAIVDSIILLLYGYKMLLKQDAVQSVGLMEAATQSGLRIDRIDRNLPSSHRQYIIKGGSGKGSRYSLNNRGLAYAQALLEELFE